MENRLGLPSQSVTANYAVVDRRTLDPVFRFRADDLRDANRIYGEWLAAAGLPTTTEDYGFQEIRPQIPEVPMDVAQNFPDRTDGRNTDYSFRDLFGTTDQASSAPAGNSFSGQWQVMIDGEEVWRFRGVGNNQADANRIAQTWLQDQRSQGLLSPAPGADVEVVPVMIESVQNSLTEIEHMKQSHFTGGKDMLGSFQKPGKKHLKPLPGGTDLMYSVTKDNYGSYVYIVDPGVPGITKQSIVASLSLIDSDLPNTFQVGSITVDEDYRGRGLARALYGIVLTIMRKNLVSGSSQTPGGRRNWLSLASIPGVEVKGLVTLSNRDTGTTVGDPKSGYNKYVEKTIDRVMELGGQFVSKGKNYNYWAFDVVPGKGQLQPAVQNALSKLYGYDSDALLMATWTGA
jgi:GNAT superfamily N-acetyltransferase